jgi:hypothetical protein
MMLVMGMGSSSATAWMPLLFAGLGTFGNFFSLWHCRIQYLLRMEHNSSTKDVARGSSGARARWIGQWK